MTKHLSDIEVRGSVTSTQTVEGQGGVITRTVSGTPVDTVSDGMIAIDTANNKLYYRSGGSWRESGSASSVATLTDVQLTDLTAGQALVYNGTNWINQTVSSGGAGAVYLATIGDGTTSLFTITHGLGTRDIVVTTRNALSPYEVINVAWNATTTTSVTLDFGMAPDPNSVRVAIYASVTGENVSLPLDALTDVVLTAPEEFQSLVYDGTNWVNKDASTSTYVRNVETTTITTGTAVYLFGATGDHADVKRADNSTDTTSSKTVGLAAVNILPSQNGHVVTRGYVDGINLSAYTSGDVLWLGKNGAFTTTKPEAPDHLVFIGVVVRATNNGIIYVATQNGYELDELHDVALSSLASGDFLKYNGSLWVNGTITLGTDTSGNYVSGVSAGTGVSVSHVPGEGSTATVSLNANINDLSDVTITGASSYDVLQWNGSAWVNSQSLTINTLPTIGGSPLSLPTLIDDDGITLYPWTMVPVGYTGPAVETTMLRTPGSDLVVSGQNIYFHPTMDRNSTMPTGVYDVGEAQAGYYLTDFWNPTGTVSTYQTRTGGINTTHVGAMSIGLNYLDEITKTTNDSNFYIAFTDGMEDINGDVTVHVPSDMTIDNPNGTLTITGNLTVSGTTTTINTENLLVEDNIIVLNSGAVAATSDAGIEVERGSETNVQIRWNELTDKWQFTNDGTTYKDLGSGGVTVSDTIPSSPAQGDMWYESDTGALFAYYDSVWIEIGGSAAYNEIIGAIQAKGDILAGTGSQAISRLGVGANGRRLAADSTTATGLAWVDDTVNTVINAKGDILAGTANDAVSRTPVGSNGQVLVANSTTTTGLSWTEYPQQFRNKFINGAFTINQRAAASYTGTGAEGKFMDMWTGYASAGTVTFSPSTIAPEGFATSVNVNVVAGASYSGTGNYCLLGTKVEGFNAVPFGWGTAWAKPATLSFWARSSIAGQYTVAFQNEGFQTSVYVATYTISTINTWERIVITVPANTSGSWNGITNTSRNSGSLWVAWSFGTDTNLQTASVNAWQTANAYGTASGVDLAATTGAQFYMTGVQLEVGSEATPFEHRDFNTELSMCQRYYEKSYNYANAPGAVANSSANFCPSISDLYNNALVHLNFKTRKRVVPSLDVWSTAGTANVWTYSRSGVLDGSTSANWTGDWAGETGGLVYFPVGAAWVTVSIRGHWVARAEM